MKTLLQLRNEIKNDLLKSVSVTGNTYSSDFIDERINATLSNICGGTVVNPANPKQMITKTNLRFLESSRIYGVTPVSNLVSDANIESSSLSVGNQVSTSDERYWSLRNQFIDVVDTNTSISFGNQTNGKVKIATMFKPHKSRLEFLNVKKRNTGGNPITSDVIVELRTNNEGVPGEIIASDVIDMATYNAVAHLSFYKVNLKANINPDKIYFIVFSTTIDVAVNGPFIQSGSVSSYRKYTIPGFTKKLPLHTLEYTGTIWRSYNNDTDYRQPIIEFNYSSSVWIEGNMIDYVTFNSVDTDINFINFPHKAGSKVHYTYELPHDYGFLTKVVYDGRFDIEGVDYRKLYQNTSLSEPRMNLNSFSGYGTNNSFKLSSMPFYSLYTDRLMLIMNGDSSRNVLIQYQMKHPYLTNDSDETLIPDNYTGAITYIATSDILSLRGEPDKAIELGQKGYSFALALSKQEGYKTKEMTFNTRVRSVSDSFLNI